MLKLRYKTGQSTVEYILLVSAVIAVIIFFVTSNGPNGFKGRMNATLDQTAQGITTYGQRLENSHAGSPNADTPPGPTIANPDPNNGGTPIAE